MSDWITYLANETDTLDPEDLTGGSDTTGEGSDTTGEEGDTTGEGSDTTGEGSDTTGEGSDTAGEGSDTTGEGSDTAGEGSDTTGEEGDTTGEEGDIAGEEGENGGTTSTTVPDYIKSHPGMAGAVGVVIVLVVVLIALVLRKKMHQKKSKEDPADAAQDDPDNQAEPAASYAPTEQMSTESRKLPKTSEAGKLHNIGMRKNQQDSFGMIDTPAGVFAVVADGMGGLADGEKVSQEVVMTMLKDAVSIREAHDPDVLHKMVSRANNAVNRMLGAANQYKSGSTLIAVLAGAGSFEWVSVGDSRIYLYRNEKLIQMNEEHIYEKELLAKAANGEISFEEAKNHPKKKGLTSFIGMGRLKYVDGSLRPVAAQEGDRVLLMSDGVFNTISEGEICSILKENEDAAQAAAVMEERVLSHQNPRQDNFTAVILKL